MVDDQNAGGGNSLSFFLSIFFISAMWDLSKGMNRYVYDVFVDKFKCKLKYI